jgi:(2S)-methylsuccinyl-CoA dehydrogenase
MSALPKDAPTALVLQDLLYVCERAYNTADQALSKIRGHVRAMVAPTGKVDSALLDQHQYATHGLSWFSTYVAALKCMLDWAKRLQAEGKLGELESLLLQACYSEYLHQIYGGVPMSQGEYARLADFGIEVRERHLLQTPYTTLLRK